MSNPDIFSEADRITHLTRSYSQVIDGKCYGTRGSTFIGVKLHPRGGDGQQGADLDEALFKTAKGAHFLSKGKLFSNRTSRLGLEPLTDAKALEWAEKNLDAATIKRHFPDVKDAVTKRGRPVAPPGRLRAGDRLRALLTSS